MGNPANFNMIAVGAKDAILAFDRIITNAEINDKGADFRPDNRIKDTEMESYGYKKGDMFPLCERVAQCYLERNYDVYILRDDNTAEKIPCGTDIGASYQAGEIFGMMKSEFLDREDKRSIQNIVYWEYPDVESAEERDGGKWAINIYGCCKYGIDTLIDDELRSEGTLALQDAARELSIDIEAFADCDGYDMHLLIGGDGTVKECKTAPSFRHDIHDFEDEEELLPYASEALEYLGIEPTKENLDEFLSDDECYLDITPFPWDFTI